jgi:hypothetical protein
MYAARWGQGLSVDYLLSIGVDANRQDQVGALSRCIDLLY